MSLCIIRREEPGFLQGSEDAVAGARLVLSGDVGIGFATVTKDGSRLMVGVAVEVETVLRATAFGERLEYWETDEAV